MPGLILTGVTCQSPAVRVVAIKCLGLVCLFSKYKAQEHWDLFFQVIARSSTSFDVCLLIPFSFNLSLNCSHSRCYPHCLLRFTRYSITSHSNKSISPLFHPSKGDSTGHAAGQDRGSSSDIRLSVGLRHWRFQRHRRTRRGQSRLDAIETTGR